MANHLIIVLKVCGSLPAQINYHADYKGRKRERENNSPLQFITLGAQVAQKVPINRGLQDGS